MRDRYQAVFDASVEGYGGSLSSNGFFCDRNPETRNYRLLVSVTTEDLETILKHDYLEWLTVLSVEYSANPENFLTAHRFLTHHPMFWIKGKEEKSYQWATDVGLSNMSINVWADEKTGKPVIFLEHGQHDEKGYTSYYHNPRIFVRQETYEQAIIDMAKKVNDVFDLDGNEHVAKETEPGE